MQIYVKIMQIATPFAPYRASLKIKKYLDQEQEETPHYRKKPGKMSPGRKVWGIKSPGEIILLWMNN